MARDDFEFSESDDDDDDRPSRRGYTRSGEPSGFVDFITFRRMLVPIIIQMVFWLGVLVIIGVALYMIIESDNIKIRAAWFLGSLLGLIQWRVFCELVIVFFRMNETLTLMHNELRRLNRKR